MTSSETSSETPSLRDELMQSVADAYFHTPAKGLVVRDILNVVRRHVEALPTYHFRGQSWETTPTR